MATPEPAPTGEASRPAGTVRRVAAVAGAALALAAVATVAAGSGRTEGGVGVALPSVRWLVVAVFVVLLLVGAVAFGVLVVQPRERRPPSATRQLRVLLIAAAIVILLLAIAGRQASDGTPATADDPAGAGDTEVPVPRDLTTDTVWRDLALLLGLVVVGAAAAVVAAGRLVTGTGGAAGDDDRQAAAALSDVLADAIAALRAEPDPRRAVIGAYALVERSLGYHRLPRRPSETAVEYLGRLLEHLDASGPAIRRLTGLFERAMFSARDVDRAMQDEAVDALVAVRDELRATAAGREAGG